ncbi:MAG TPA: hypothetical protein VNU95_02510 [Candidatus Acidoferrales bacterium]|jgi:hypothetical protein|nr:hypothetical protein [Candidatus Acidoferrales bacterium]
MILVAVGLFQIARYVLDYYLGHSEKSYTPIFIESFLFVLNFLLLLVFTIVWLVTIVKGKNNPRITATWVLLLILILPEPLHLISPPADMIIYGMRERLLRDYNEETLRNLAHDFNRLPVLPDNPTGRKIYLNRNLAQTDLPSKYSFLEWISRPGSSGPAYISERNDVVDVRWGGSLTGHWGFSVAVNGVKIDPPTGASIKSIRISNDIYLIIGED